MPYKVYITEANGVFSARHKNVVKEMEDQGDGELYCEFELGGLVLACFRTSRGEWKSQEGHGTTWIDTKTHYVLD